MSLLRPENNNRKIDNLGRITLPKGLRARLYLEENSEMELYTMDYEGRTFVCLTKDKQVNPKYLIAKEVLEEFDIDIPVELLEKIDG